MGPTPHRRQPELDPIQLLATGPEEVPDHTVVRHNRIPLGDRVLFFDGQSFEALKPANGAWMLDGSEVSGTAYCCAAGVQDA
jgi:hypothetical protein